METMFEMKPPSFPISRLKSAYDQKAETALVNDLTTQLLGGQALPLFGELDSPPNRIPL